MDGNMLRRVAFAVIAIPCVVGIVWYGEWPLTLLLMAVASLGINELFRLAASGGLKPFFNTGRFLAAIVPLFLLLMIRMPTTIWILGEWGYVAVLAVLLVIGVAVFTIGPLDRPLGSIAVTLFGVVYTAVLPCMVFVIRHAQWGERSWTGTALAFFPLVVTWIGDSAAMFGGRMIGGPKLVPTISPAKTRAGGIAGLIAGAAVGAAFAIIVFPRVGVDLGVLPAVALALVLAVVGQIGDLAESLFKREAGVKDSSALIPGHGGILDRLDSLYFAIPVAAVGFRLLGVL